MARGRRAKRWEYEVVTSSSIGALCRTMNQNGHEGRELVCVIEDAASVFWQFYKCPWRPMRQWRVWECEVMNLLDFRYWRCDCEYAAPYGKVIFMGCEKHD